MPVLVPKKAGGREVASGAGDPGRGHQRGPDAAIAGALPHDLQARRRHGDAGQLLPAERRGGGHAGHVGRAGPPSWATSRWPTSAPTPSPGLEPERMGLGPALAVPKALKKAGHPPGGRRAVGDQRGLRRAVPGRRAGAGTGPQQGQRQRRGHRPRPPHRRDRRAPRCSPWRGDAEAQRAVRRRHALRRRRPGRGGGAGTGVGPGSQLKGRAALWKRPAFCLCAPIEDLLRHSSSVCTTRTSGRAQRVCNSTSIRRA